VQEMPKFIITVLTPFTDVITNECYKQYQTIEIESAERTVNIISRGLGELVEARHDKRGKRIIIHQAYVGTQIGGINTANRHIAKAFANYNLAFVVDGRDMPTAMELARYCDVIIDNKQKYECDVFIMSNYNTASIILPRVKARKIYTLIHADFGGLCKLKSWSVRQWKPDDRCDRVLAVSETAQKGLKEAFNVESVVTPNILTAPDERKVFMYLGRSSVEKGVDRIIELYDRFAVANKEFCFYLCGDVSDATLAEQIAKRKRFIQIRSSAYNQELIKSADYLVQLSYNESYCYSIREALQRKVPVIASDIPEFKKVIKDGKNGFILKDDFSNLDVDKIFNTKFNLKPYTEDVPEIWREVLRGNL